MKTWKTEIINAIIKKTEDYKIVSLKETAAEFGITHISRQDTDDILRAVLKSVPGYKAVEIHDSKNDKMSRFCSLCFVENDFEIEDR